MNELSIAWLETTQHYAVGPIRYREKCYNFTKATATLGVGLSCWVGACVVAVLL